MKCEMTLKCVQQMACINHSKQHQVDSVQRLIQKPTCSATSTKEVECPKTVPPARIELATPGLGILFIAPSRHFTDLHNMFIIC